MTQNHSFTEVRSGPLLYMAASNIGAPHAFTTRLGGVSCGIYASLNLKISPGDPRENTAANYGAICGALGISPSDLVRANQVHGRAVRLVTGADRGALLDGPRHDADGLITAERGMALAVLVADCAPILLHDPVSGAVGAVHAGWRSTAADIAGAAVSKMARELGCSPGNIRAAIGPCISRCCFETDSDVADAMFALFAAPHERERVALRRGGKYHIDLKAANALLLERAGLRAENISASDECTRCGGDKYWSHRASSGRRGSQAAIIAAAR
jgi:YfiH family protein